MKNNIYLSSQLLWIAISLGISLIISFLIPFPFSLPIIIVVFVLLSFFLQKRKRERGGLRIQMYKNDYLNYYCLNCETCHKDKSCPRCGLTKKRAGL
jgi:hypothetical protein